MKLTAAAAIAILAFTSDVVAQHKHHHARQAKADRRDEVLEKRVVETVVELKYVYVDQDGIPWESTPTDTPTLVQEAEVVASTSALAYTAPDPPAYTVPSPSSKPSSSQVSQVSTSTSAAAEPSSSGKGEDADFPDATIPCSEFPSDYGALKLDYLGHDGWTGIQLGGTTLDSCTNGAYCSYACPPGYSKSQWPADQPSSGESRGGLLCNNGKLTLTRPSASKLCVPGQGSAFVVNNMSKEVAVCRTDYPGTENMVIPTVPSPGETLPLTVVVSDDYYMWQGNPTSAQYYVNSAGVSVKDGCLWGTETNGVGNWAPLVFGAGYRNGDTWISMFPNPLANGAVANYNVKIVASPGSTINGDCTYINGVFSTPGGCTVCVTSGSAHFVFED